MGGVRFCSSGQQLLAGFLAELQSESFKDVEVCCVDGVERLPRLLLASLSPTLTTCLAQAEDQPVILLPHNTRAHIRMLVRSLISGTDHIPASYLSTFHWVDFTRPRKWTVSGITSSSTSLTPPPQPFSSPHQFSELGRDPAGGPSPFCSRKRRRSLGNSQLVQIRNSTLDIISRNIDISNNLDVTSQSAYQQKEEENGGVGPPYHQEASGIMVPGDLRQPPVEPDSDHETRTSAQSAPQASGEQDELLAVTGQEGSVTALQGSLEPKVSESSQCPECGKVLYDSYCLRRHEAAVHQKLRPFPCHTCAKSFFSRRDLAAHVGAVHQPEKNWVCEVCGAALSSLKALQAHGLIHKGAASMVETCRICLKTFRHRNTLTKHVDRVHKFDKSHQLPCVQCRPLRFFRHKEGLTRHQRKIHSGQKDFRCQLCGTAFSFNYDLSRHLRRAHPAPRPDSGEELGRVEEGEVIFICNPLRSTEEATPAALILPDPFPLEVALMGGARQANAHSLDIVQLALSSHVLTTSDANTSAATAVVLAASDSTITTMSGNSGTYSQNQTVAIKSLGYNCILGE